MKLIAMTIPDDPAELAGWLERRLVGLDLAALVAELSAIHGDRPSAAGELDALLGGHRDAVLNQGLSALPAAGLRELMRRPSVLLELQELILIDGGDYWRSLARAS